MLKHGTIVDAKIIAAPSSTKNCTGTRDSEMHQAQKGNQWYFGMKAHVGSDSDNGSVHTVVGTAASVADVTVAHELLHGNEKDSYGDSAYQGVKKRAENAGSKATWYIAIRIGKRKALGSSKIFGTWQYFRT